MIATIKRHMPEPVRVMARGIRSRAVFPYDRRRFLAYYAGNASRKHSQSQLEAQMIFFAHSLEKGLSHSELRYQFGINALRSLASAMDEFSCSGFDKNSAAYVNGLSVLREYVALHDASGENTGHVREIFSEAVVEEVLSCDSCLGGTLQVSKKDKSENRDKTFRDLFLGRWSIREYADTSVDIKLLAEAIQIATKAPSVCNRQSARVTIFTDQEIVRQILDVQGGFTGYPLPPVLLMITTETSVFLSVTERNQVYTDGGLFSMALLLGLEYVSLAACALNAMFTVRDERKMRRIAGIPESENIIMFVAVGNFREQVSVPKSFRFSGSDITRGPGGGRCWVARGVAAEIRPDISRVSSLPFRRTELSHDHIPESRSLLRSTDRSLSSGPVLRLPLTLTLGLSAWEMCAIAGARLAESTGESEVARTTRSFVHSSTARTHGADADPRLGSARPFLPAVAGYSSAWPPMVDHVHHH